MKLGVRAEELGAIICKGWVTVCGRTERSIIFFLAFVFLLARASWSKGKSGRVRGSNL